jgi:tetratricopeptide (TPR) repeat protein
MGFDVTRVVSDVTHYSVFICKICQQLVSLDALVTPCNHPFCRACLEVWMQKREAEDLNCRCPSCELDLEAPSKNNNHNGDLTFIANTPIQVKPLKDAQPLAFQLLKLVQVACHIHNSDQDHDCSWTGDYADWKKHQVKHKMASSDGRSASVPNLFKNQPNGGAEADREEKISLRDQNLKSNSLRDLRVGKDSNNSLSDSSKNKRPTLYSEDAEDTNPTSNRGEATAAHHHRSAYPQHQQDQDSPGGVSEDRLPDLAWASERCDKLKKQANAKFNRGDVEGARMLYSEGLALVANFPLDNQEVRKLTASLYSNRAVTYFRERILPPSIEDCDTSLELDPKSEKTYIRKWRALSAMGKMVDAIACLEVGLREIPKSAKLAEELRKSKAAPIADDHIMDMNHSVMDMNYSVASMSVFSKVGTVQHDANSDLDRAEKLKKQANAKFNKGDIEAARALYTDSISCIPNTGGQSEDIRELLGMLYSNRAVTFFRDKMYRESLGDCVKAIEFDPRTEKSYIRKSRALAGLEMYSDAYRCLESAHILLPNSTKISEEMEKAKEKMYDIVPTKGGSFGMDESACFNNSAGSFVLYSTDDKDYSDDLDLADKLKRNANAKFNRGDISGARLLYTEALACLPDDRNNTEVRASLASLYANRAVTFFREKEFGPSSWDCDKAIELDPKSEKSYIRKARALASLKKFDESVKCLEIGLTQCPNSRKLEEELVKAQELQSNDNPNIQNRFSDAQRQDFQVSAIFDFDPNKSISAGADNNSIGSLNFFISPTGSSEKVTLNSGVVGNVALPFSSNEDLERAEKLKKQANAKLNKGDVSGARVLYGEGLACLPSDGPRSPEGRELAASLYANRAVTFFREKAFAAAVMDCDKSLELDPKHEKSYIRKWRALMALGNFEESYRCLKTATKELPRSERLHEELANSTEQRELLATINRLIATGEYQEARDTLKPIITTSDNVSLWLAAARADAYLGLTESALERVNKVLVFNATHSEGLQVRGYATFLSGEMEQGIGTLKEALDEDTDKDNPDASEQLEKCHRTFSAFSKGQARVKRGRYKEAVIIFTGAMEDGISIPSEAPLYGLLLTERAEASLLSEQYEDALADCNEAIKFKNDNLAAWTVKVEVYFALGRLQEARDELAQVRRTWGAGNETIEEAYKKTDFEWRVQKADDDLHKLVAAVESGLPERFERADRGRGSSRKLVQTTTPREPSKSFTQRSTKSNVTPSEPSKSFTQRSTKSNVTGKSDTQREPSKSFTQRSTKSNVTGKSDKGASSSDHKNQKRPPSKSGKNHRSRSSSRGRKDRL